MAQNSFFYLSNPNRGIRINHFPTLDNPLSTINNQITYMPTNDKYLNNIQYINNNQIHNYGTNTLNNLNYTSPLTNNYYSNNNVVNFGNIGIPRNELAQVIPLNTAPNIGINNQERNPKIIYTFPNIINPKTYPTINNPHNTLINPNLGLNTLNQEIIRRPSARPLSHNTLDRQINPNTAIKNNFIISNANKANNINNNQIIDKKNNSNDSEPTPKIIPTNTNINANKFPNNLNILSNNNTNQKQLIQNNNNNININQKQINQNQVNPLTNDKNKTMIMKPKEIPNQNNSNSPIKNPAIVRKVSKTIISHENLNQNDNDINKDIVTVKKINEVKPNKDIPNKNIIDMDKDLVTVEKINQNKIDINKAQPKVNNIINKEIPNQNINNRIPQTQATVTKIGEEKFKQEIPNQNINNNIPRDEATVKKITNENVPAPTPKPIQIPLKIGPISESDLKNITNYNVGMMNLGNTCFINSILQVLIHCPIFIHKFFEQRKSINKNDTLISAYFYEVCLAMVNCKNTQEHYIDITNFKSVFGTKHPDFEGYCQNDSQEFCRVFLEDISEELNEIKNKAIYKTLTNSNRRDKRFKDKEFFDNFESREKSIITELFYSQLITIFTCQCKAAIYSFQKILDFPLLLPQNIQKIDIMNLLKAYFQTESIDFERKCDICKKVSKHQKQVKISRPPEILILSLQRIDQLTQKKNECVVTFPQILNISEFIDHEIGFDKEPIYKLFAVVNHQGSIDSGHYYSYILRNNQWYLFNDSSVKVFLSNIESFPYAYALFYIKQKYL